MLLKKFMTLAAIAAFSVIPVAGSAAAPKPAQNLALRNWNVAVAVTASGSHVLGNPDAAIKLIEFVSYTCQHCAHFEMQSEGALRLGYISSGKVSAEVRHFIRDPVDLTVALLTNCGPPARFFGNHTMFMRGQEKWIALMATAGPRQRERWSAGTFAIRTRNIAQDFGFYALMSTRGYDRPTLDRCLADEAAARRLASGSAAAEALGVEGTPSFMINDLLLAGTHDWRSLEPQINARL